jgi:hypothetical protein
MMMPRNATIPGYLVIVDDQGREWARKSVDIAFSFDPETRKGMATADFETFDVTPPLKKRERRACRLEFRDLTDALLIANDWQGRDHPIGRKDIVRVYGY